METTPSTTTDTPNAEPAKPKAAHGSKSSRITLVSGDATLFLNAKAKKDGTAETFVTTKATKKAASVRGMTTKHKSLTDAVAALETLATAAAKDGWQRKTARAGFRAAPDAFASLPKPPKAGGRK